MASVSSVSRKTSEDCSNACWINMLRGYCTNILQQYTQVYMKERLWPTSSCRLVWFPQMAMQGTMHLHWQLWYDTFQGHRVDSDLYCKIVESSLLPDIL